MLIDDPVHPDELRVKVLDFGIAKIARRSAPNSAKRTGIGSYMGTVKIIRGARRWRLLFGGEDRRSGGAGMQAMVLNYAQR